MERVPLVDYLVLGDEPHLVAAECTDCGARYFDRRSACARCGGLEFGSADVPTEGVLTTFTIVQFAAEGVEVPFVAGVVDCDGTSVKGNVVNTPPDPEHVTLGMRVRLTTVPVGTDADGVEAVGYGFEPID
ncbi:Zn-ribbon domain-containing OB-fold protein [Blastococcus sp. URHD0036]|uniref:Zn-ribbon domain-containing OB-fold protein n=1 Tax=Blastococcus sp. URHD0036 TaxID=1380356 RepID=UPI000497EC2F|nr:OB-fold domain-containing protein [Blastococcus sp. URHD0036]